MKVLIKNTSLCFALLGILFIPFPFVFLPYQARVSEGLFGAIIRFFIEKILAIKEYHPFIVSDSLMMYVLLLLLFVVAFLMTISTNFFSFKFVTQHKIQQFLQSFFSYYLALILIKYGFDKVFLGQFYTPEPNILYTPLGFLDKDILFWSTMGVSPIYNIFMGVTEIIAATLLLFNRTRLIGALFSCGVFINIIAINFSFDISVKLYSSFLLFLSFLILRPFIHQLYSFLILKKTGHLSKRDQFINSIFKPSFARTFFKTFVILLIVTEGLYPNLQAQPLPYLHGAYQVINVTQNDKKRDLRSIPFKRFFVHKDHYLIFQYHDGQMNDYKLGIDKVNNQLILTNYSLKKDTLSYQFKAKNNQLELIYTLDKKQYQVTTQQLKQKDLPLMEKRFHWMIDGR